jgi:hypothetical protein
MDINQDWVGAAWLALLNLATIVLKVISVASMEQCIWHPCKVCFPSKLFFPA